MSYFTHGHTAGGESRTYKSWTMMLQRCLNPKDSSYSRYGARGIVVSERWMRFEVFLADMGERPPGTTLDRYPNKDGHYEPGNCRWATPRQQQNNLRSNARVMHDGKELTLSEWAQELSLSYTALKQRYRSGDRSPYLFRPIDGRFNRYAQKVLVADAEKVKICECGCGQQTQIAKITNSRRGSRKGYPVRFIRGHNMSARTLQEFLA